MSKRDLFIILIKLFGLYSLIFFLFSSLPSNILFVFTSSLEINTMDIIWSFISLLIVFGLFYFLVKKAEKVCDFLSLDKGFETKNINFSEIKTIDIIRLGILFIGGILFIENIPIFLSNIFVAFKLSIPKSYDNIQQGNPLNIKNYIDLIISFLNLLIGYLIISNFKKIGKFIDGKVKE